MNWRHVPPIGIVIIALTFVAASIAISTTNLYVKRPEKTLLLSQATSSPADARSEAREAADAYADGSGSKVYRGADGWTWFENADDGYVLQVPADWILEEDRSHAPSAMSVEFLPSGLGREHGVDGPTLLVTSQLHDERFDEWRAAQPSDGKGLHEYKVENSVVGGAPAVRLVQRTIPGDPKEPLFNVVTLVQRGDRIYKIEFYGPNQDEVEQQIDVYERALSTFRFAR